MRRQIVDQMPRIISVVAALILLYGGVTHADAITIIDPPGTTYTQVSGISGNNVVGWYTSGGVRYGFLDSGGTYTEINPAGSTDTAAWRIPAIMSSASTQAAVSLTVTCTTAEPALPSIPPDRHEPICLPFPAILPAART